MPVTRRVVTALVSEGGAIRHDAPGGVMVTDPQQGAVRLLRSIWRATGCPREVRVILLPGHEGTGPGRAQWAERCQDDLSVTIRDGRNGLTVSAHPADEYADDVRGQIRSDWPLPAGLADAWRAWSRWTALLRGWGIRRPAGSPVAVGRHLLALHQSSNAGTDQLPPLEIRHEIAQGATQGRIQFFPGAAAEGARLNEWDMRAAYMAGLPNLPVGPVQTIERPGPELVESERWRPGFWLATARPPAGWDHLGLMPTRNVARGLTWSPKGGTAWITGAELALLLKWGWTATAEVAYLWPQAARRPTDRWARQLTTAVEELTERHEHDAAKIVRTVAINTVGGFAQRYSRAIKYGDEAEFAAAQNAGKEIERWSDVDDGRRYSWVERTDRTDSAQFRPEWAATVWGRTRARLLDGPPAAGGRRTGALHLPLSQIVALRTDALFTVNAEPNWPDDGKVGRMRLKTTDLVPADVRTVDDLHRTTTEGN